MFRVSAPDSEAPVLLLHHILSSGRLDAHPRWLPQLHEEAMRNLAIADDASVSDLPELAVLSLEVDLSLLGALHLDGGVAGLVALEPVAARGPVTNETLLTLQHQDRPVDQVEVVLASLLDGVNIGEQMAGLLGPDILVVASLESHSTVLEPDEIKECRGSSARFSGLETAACLQGEILVLGREAQACGTETGFNHNFEVEKGEKRMTSRTGGTDLHCPDAPLCSGCIKLQLEGFMVTDLLLVGGHVHT